MKLTKPEKIILLLIAVVVGYMFWSMWNIDSAWSK